jgi:hypothetical protein
MTNLEKYQKIAKNPISMGYPKSFLFNPQGDDYEELYVNRYFIKKINDDDIIEVSSENYKTISGVLYSLVCIKWKISGPKTTIIKNGIVTTEGVIEFNRKQTLDSEKTMPGISKRLKNPLEGYREL